MYVAVKALK